MTNQNVLTRYEIEQFLDGKPDTKLKKELLDMLQPEEDKRKEFEQYVQHVYNLLCDALGKRRVTIHPGKDYYGDSLGNEVLVVGKFRVVFRISFEYQEQQAIEVRHKNGGYSLAEIRVKPGNPEFYVDLAKIVLDFLNGRKHEPDQTPH